jgi:hypothetical protein
MSSRCFAAAGLAILTASSLGPACDPKDPKRHAREDYEAGGEGGAEPDPAGVFPDGGALPAPTSDGGAGGVAEAGAGGALAGGAGGASDGEVETACPPGVLGHCSLGETYADYPGYELALVEDFPAPLDLDTDPILTWSDGSVNASQTSFRREQISFEDGNLLITAEPPPGCPTSDTNPGCIPARQSFAEALAPNTQASVPATGLWSGELRTRYNNYRYGRYEAKFRAPLANPKQATANDAAGFMATLFVFRSPRNVQWNEIDLELVPNLHDHVQGNVVNASGQQFYPSANAHPIQPAGPTGYDIAQEHVYAFTWTPTKVEWFLDGNSLESFEGSANDPIPTLSAKIMMSLWVFVGTTFGPPSGNQYPMHSTYDYVRFYKLSGETYPCDGPPGCLSASDLSPSAQNNPSE